MTINQAFTILQNAGGIRAARIITENTKKFSRFSVCRMARKLRRGVPVAKIINKKWFYGLTFYTNTHTLDPRPDTETLVSAILSDPRPNSPQRILDLGTGTGCIICALVKNIHNASGTAIDKSWRALRVARKNIKNLNLTNKIDAIHASFMDTNKIGEKFDIIYKVDP